MLSQFAPELEWQLLFYLIPVSIGIQLSLYFFYQYFKLQDINLKLNRILLSFGSFTLLIILGALQLNISRLFIVDPLLSEIIYRIGWASALSSPIAFNYFIAVPEFSGLINLRILKVVLLISFIPIIVVFFVPTTRSPIFLGVIFFSVPNAYYVLSFQIRVIRRSMGLIRKKFIQFFLGELISLSSLGFAVPVGLGILAPGVNEIVFYSGVSILITGFIILFFSAYEFPPFYEYNWRENLSKLFIINQKGNTSLYYCDLANAVTQLKHEKKVQSEIPKSDRDRIFSGGIAGIESLIALLTDTKMEKIDKISHEDSQILLEYGTQPNITYALVVKKDLDSLRHLLQSLKSKFELFYHEILLNLDKFTEIQDKLFNNFDLVIKNALKQ